MPEDIQKINVRSPFYITVVDEGAPDEPATADDPIDDPTPPADTVQPDTLTQEVLCGETVKVGEDIGGKIYNLKVGAATGTVTINYTVNIPISITATWNTTVPNFSTSGYVGNSDFEQELLDSGITSGNMNLASGVQTGSVTINKTAASPETVSVLVSAPLPTDDYQLTFNCPSAPSVSPGTLPSSPTVTKGTLIDVVPAFYLANARNAYLKLTVNGTQVVNVGGSYIFPDTYYAFTDFNTVGNYAIGHIFENSSVSGGVTTQLTPTQHLAKSTYFNTDVNVIEIEIIHKQNTKSFAIADLYYNKGGIVYDDRTSSFRYILFTKNEANYFKIYPGVLGNSTISKGQFYRSGITPAQGSQKFIFYYRHTPTNEEGLDHPRRPLYNVYYAQGRCFSSILDGVDTIHRVNTLQLD
mgnify:FL=1|jgi:hypothetical protein|tara:strand:- start:5901 stop:7136 length:1236 start_codon:yes stop_codon:yes gene_type:complete